MLDAQCVWYMRLIGDGDSSVMCNIKDDAPSHVASKIECANHVYRNRLEEIIQQFQKYKGKGKLLKRVVTWLTAEACATIKMYVDMESFITLERVSIKARMFYDHQKLYLYLAVSNKDLYYKDN